MPCVPAPSSAVAKIGPSTKLRSQVGIILLMKSLLTVPCYHIISPYNTIP
jgi:hypothetical protein